MHSASCFSGSINHVFPMFVFSSQQQWCLAYIQTCAPWSTQHSTFKIIINNFIEATFTYYKIHPMNVQLNDFCIFTELCNSHHNLILEYLHYARKKSHPIYNHSSLPTPALGNPQSTFYPYRFVFSDISYKWNRTEVFCV